LIFFIVQLEKNLRRTKYAIIAPRRTGEIDPKKRTLPAINSFKRGGFCIRGRGRDGGVMAPPTRLNNISVLIGRGINYIDKIEYFLYYEKEYYLNIYLNNQDNF
jgi:hypothetical protein